MQIVKFNMQEQFIITYPFDYEETCKGYMFGFLWWSVREFLVLVVVYYNTWHGCVLMEFLQNY
jgi:hypothetical protein